MSQVRALNHVSYKFAYGNQSYIAHAAFEVKVKTQALCGTESQPSCAIGASSNSESFETWSTKETGACILTALLIRLVRFESSE